MTDLASQRCQPCTPGSAPLTLEQATELQGQIDAAWRRQANQLLTRDFRFANFGDAFGLATRVALLAQEEGHHPDLEIGWGRLRLNLTTHAAGGLTGNDFVLAAKVDQLVAGSGVLEA